MKQDVPLLESLFGTSDLPTIEKYLTDVEEETRAKAIWALTKFSVGITFEQVREELISAKKDRTRIFLAGALYLLNSSYQSREMIFLSKYYLQHYFDVEKEELKVDFTGDYGRSAIVIGLILWDVGYEIFATNTLDFYGLNWLIEK